MNIKHLLPRTLLIGSLLAGAAGCYSTRVNIGPAGGAASPMYTERWHHTIVGGLAEISDPVDLEGACPGGLAAIHEELSFLNGVAGAVFGIYTPRTYPLLCGGGAPGAAAPAAGWGAPPPGAPTAPAAQ